MLDLTSFYGQFREEATDNVQLITAGLLVLERMPQDRATLDVICRAAHTIKGSACLLGFDQVGHVAHMLEALLVTVRDGRASPLPDLNDLLLEAAVALLALVNAAVDGQPEPGDAAALAARLHAGQGPGDIHPPTTQTVLVPGLEASAVIRNR